MFPGAAMLGDFVPMERNGADMKTASADKVKGECFVVFRAIFGHSHTMRSDEFGELWTFCLDFEYRALINVGF